MSAPDPDSISWLTKAITGIAGISAAVTTPVIWFNRQLSKKADNTRVDKCLEHIEKLYENAEKDRAITRDLHDKAMDRVMDGQRQIIDMISRRQ